MVGSSCTAVVSYVLVVRSAVAGELILTATVDQTSAIITAGIYGQIFLGYFLVKKKVSSAVKEKLAANANALTMGK